MVLCLRESKRGKYKNKNQTKNPPPITQTNPQTRVVMEWQEESVFELLSSSRQRSGVEVSLTFSLLKCFEAAPFLFPLSVLVAVVKDKEVFLTTLTETTENLSFQFFPHLGCTFVFKMEIVCCILIVPTVLISACADVISVTSCCSFQTFCFLVRCSLLLSEHFYLFAF